VLPWDDFCRILHRGQRMAKVQNGLETLPKISTSSIGTRMLQTDLRQHILERNILTFR